MEVRTILLAALVLAFPVTLEAQVSAARPFEVRVTGSLGSLPLPEGTLGCAWWCISRGVALGVSGRVAPAVDLVYTVAQSSAVSDSLFMVAYVQVPGFQVVRSYRRTLRSGQLVTQDLRVRVGFGPQRRYEGALGLGMSRSPDDMPYLVMSAGLRPFRQHVFRLGLEHRTYWMRHHDVMTRVDGGYLTNDVHTERGRSRARTMALTASFAWAFGGEGGGGRRRE